MLAPQIENLLRKRMQVIDYRSSIVVGKTVLGAGSCNPVFMWHCHWRDHTADLLNPR